MSSNMNNAPVNSAENSKNNKKKRKEFGIEYWVTVILLVLFFLNIPNILFLSGKYYVAKKNYVLAYRFLNCAHFFKPMNKDVRFYLVKTMTGLKATEQIQMQIYKFSESYKKDVAANLAQLQVERWRQIILNSIGSNYIEQVPFDRNVIRWDVNTFPLTVRIDVTENVPEYYVSEIKKAFSEWAIRTNFLKFELNDSYSADIVVKFEQLPADICSDGVCKYVVAYTNPEIQGKILKSMTITMYDKDANGNYFSDKEIYNTILHEIGHALGIMGHSYSADDLMYMSTMPEFNMTRYRSDFHFLSEDDLNTIKLLYKLIPNISNVPMSKFDKTDLVYAPIILGNEYQIGLRKIKEAENYIKSAPNLPGGYIDLGVAYADVGKTQEAVKAFKVALEKATTDNDKYVIYFNLAVIHMNNNKLDDAEMFLKLAQDINDNAEVSELFTNINHARATNSKPFKSKIVK